jgi:FkbM family methyltransferase
MNNLIKMGTNYGGWYIPEQMNLNADSIVYSGGVGEDISFDIKLQSKYGCTVILIDPTKKALDHYNEALAFFGDTRTKFTGNIQPDYYAQIRAETPNFDKIKYVNLGLWNIPDTLKFYKQSNQNYVSQSLIENMFGDNYDLVQVDTIGNIMAANGHTKIDLLKLDIEGAEIPVIHQMLDDGIYPRYLLVEFDLLLKQKDPKKQTHRLIERLITNEGYQMLKNDNLNITFSR